MSRKTVLVAALVVAACAAAVGPLTSASRGDARAPRTIGLVTPDGAAGFANAVETGGAAAASALGDLLAVTRASDPADQVGIVQSLIDQHVAAIAINNQQGPGAGDKLLLPLAKARAAGIPTLTFEQPSRGSVWVNQSSPQQYAQALADALAAQMRGKGQYVIVPCRPGLAIVQTFRKAIEAYVPQRYPRMKKVAVVYGDTGNGDADKGMLRRLIKRHPRLRGLIFLCPGEAYIVPQQIIHAHKVGKVFSAGNGGDCPPLSESETPLPRYVRRGAEVIVCVGGGPFKLGYLIGWAAHYLATGHTFAPGQYDVGGPVGTVSYYEPNMELRLGQPLTITKANVDQYTGP
jgi:ABC-type sugar transport system substrate-binding protein